MTTKLVLESGGPVIELASQGEFFLHDGTNIVSSFRAANIATTSTLGSQVANTTAATALVPVQYGLGVGLGKGAAWDTDDTVSRTEEWMAEVRPASAAAVTFTVDGSEQAVAATVAAANLASMTLSQLLEAACWKQRQLGNTRYEDHAQLLRGSTNHTLPVEDSRCQALMRSVPLTPRTERRSSERSRKIASSCNGSFARQRPR